MGKSKTPAKPPSKAPKKAPTKAPSNALVKAPTKVPPSKKRKAMEVASSSISSYKIPGDYDLVINEPEFRKVFDSIIQRKIETTRFPSKKVLEDLGLYENVHQLLSNIGWASLFDDTQAQDRNTYERVVLEVMSTLKEEEGRFGSIEMSFRLKGKKCHWSSDEIHDLFCIPRGGYSKPPPEFKSTDFWKELVHDTDAKFVSGTSKSNHVRNPIFRMVLKILAHTVLARKENTSVRDPELFILWAMLTKTRVNFAYLWIKQLFKQAHVAQGVVAIGGMLTLFAKKVDPNVFGYSPMEGVTFFDIDQLRDMKFLKSKNAPYLFVQKVGPPFPLPNTELVKVTNLLEKTNWQMDKDTHKFISETKTINYGLPNEERVMQEEVGDEDEEVGLIEGYTELSERMTRMEDNQTLMNANITVMRQEITSIRLAQQGEIMRNEIMGNNINAMRELLEQFRDYQVNQGFIWPHAPPH